MLGPLAPIRSRKSCHIRRYGEKIFEIVRHPARQVAYGFHLLRLAQLPLQDFAFRDVEFRSDEVRNFDSNSAHRRDRHPLGIQAAALAPVRVMVEVRFRLF